MPHVKTPEERGPIGSWAYETRDRLGLSVEQVIDRLPTKYHPATLRKVEGGSAQPSKRMLRELAAIYGPEAERRGERYAEPPSKDARLAVQGDLVDALLAQTDALSQLVLELREGRATPADAPAHVDEKTRRRRRAYWIDQAVRETKLTRTQLRAAVGLPAGREATLRRWLDGELPKGAELERLARAIMLPMEVLEEPPATDLERLVDWRRQTLSEVSELEVEPEPARKRRTA